MLHTCRPPPPPHDPARILVRRGRHAVSLGEDAVYEIRGYIDIVGEDGAALVGSVFLLEGGGKIRNLSLEAEEGTCVWAMGGDWEVKDCKVMGFCKGRPAMVCDKDATIYCSQV